MAESAQKPCYWLLDLRNVWLGTKIDDAAPHALSLVDQAEASKSRAFHFLKDAKLSLGSSLLKRLFAVTRGVPWAEATFARRGDRKHGKPCLILGPLEAAPTREGEYDFNVSHQAGLVALAGFSGVGEAGRDDDNADGAADAARTAQPRATVKSVGVDIVCVGERNDARSIQRAGFAGWIDMHVDVFSDADLRIMKAPVEGSADELGAAQMNCEGPAMQTRLRRFYAYWALKEAYVKLEGEALLADWLREVEFRRVKVPDAVVAAVADGSANSINDGHHDGEVAPAWGEVTAGIEVWLRGKKREDVELFLQAYDDNYMIATALLKHDPSGEMEPPKWKVLDLERDVYPFAT